MSLVWALRPYGKAVQGRHEQGEVFHCSKFGHIGAQCLDKPKSSTGKQQKTSRKVERAKVKEKCMS